MRAGDRRVGRGILLFGAAMGCLTLASLGYSRAAGIYDDAVVDPENWSAFGRTAGEQHFSPLTGINDKNVAKLGLVWSMDLPAQNSVSAPLAVDGVLYTATGYSIVRAIEATTGKILWEYDPKAAEAAGRKLRQGCSRL